MQRESWKFLILIASLCTSLVASFGCATDGKQLDGTSDEPALTTGQAEQDIGGGDPPGRCSGVTFCYCSCRVFHPCSTNPAECIPLSQCLSSCDAQFPGCSPGGPLDPKRIQDCL
ncbi:MAG: hypothetical protein ABIY55_07855 [Kofleriaceae bacterium]